MLRNTRSTSMGLLDGLQSLQGAPPPNGHTVPNGKSNFVLSGSGSGVGLGGTTSSGSNNNIIVNGNNDALGQFAAGARGFFTDVSSKLGDTLGPAVDNLSENAKSSVTSLRRMMGDESIIDDDLENGNNGVGGGPTTTTTTTSSSSSTNGIQQTSLSEEMSSMFNLTMFQRIALFAMCFGTGILLIAMSFTFLPLIVLAPHKFAASFTMGNLLAIVSTWILVGPRAQLESMFSPGRALAASVYIVSLIITLVAAFFGGNFRYVFVLVALVAEISSLCWYALSYIPYGRHMMSRFIGLFTG